MAWRDGTVHLAEIVETRKAEGDSDAAAGASSSSAADGAAGADSSAGASGGGNSGGGGSSSGGAAGAGTAGRTVGGVGSVYVHYVDFDRRLDEWVSMDRVDLAAGQQKAAAPHNGDKRRVTTRMKRECRCGSVRPYCSAISRGASPSFLFSCTPLFVPFREAPCSLVFKGGGGRGREGGGCKLHRMRRTVGSARNADRRCRRRP